MNNMESVLGTKIGNVIDKDDFQINSNVLKYNNSEINFIFDSKALKKFLLNTFNKTSRDKVQSNMFTTFDTKLMTPKNCIIKIRQLLVILHLNAKTSFVYISEERQTNIISKANVFAEIYNSFSKNSRFLHFAKVIGKKNFENLLFFKITIKITEGKFSFTKVNEEQKLKIKKKSCNCNISLNNLQRFNIYEYIV